VVARRWLLAAAGGACVAAVAAFGELSIGALVAVLATGLAVTAAGLARRAGAGAAPVGRGGWLWLAWFAAVVGWELLVLADDGPPTVSDLADPVLAPPAARAAATVVWLAAGWWLLRRPRGRGQG
jgi:hypothetical protein